MTPPPATNQSPATPNATGDITLAPIAHAPTAVATVATVSKAEPPGVPSLMPRTYHCPSGGWCFDRDPAAGASTERRRPGFPVRGRASATEIRWPLRSRQVLLRKPDGETERGGSGVSARIPRGGALARTDTSQVRRRALAPVSFRIGRVAVPLGECGGCSNGGNSGCAVRLRL
jgi:hypothetical protein